MLDAGELRRDRPRRRLPGARHALLRAVPDRRRTSPRSASTCSRAARRCSPRRRARPGSGRHGRASDAPLAPPHALGGGVEGAARGLRRALRPRAPRRATREAAARAAAELGFPVALKLCGDGIAHKTERDLVRLGLADGGRGARGGGRAARQGAPRGRPGVAARGRDGARPARADRRPGARPELRSLRAARPRRHPGRGAARRRVRRGAALARGGAAPARAAARRAPRHAALPRRAPRRRRGAGGRAARPRAPGRGAPRRRERRPESADRRAARTPLAVDALVELGEPAAAPPLPPARSDAELLARLRPLFHPAGRRRGRRLQPSRQVRLRDAPQPAPLRLSRGDLPGEPGRRGGARRGDACATSPWCPKAPPTSSSCARRTR